MPVCFGKRVLCLAAAGVAWLPCAAAQEKAAKGLDAVSDDALVEELTRYGMGSLLERYAQTHAISGEKHPGAKGILAVYALLHQSEKLPAAQRQQRVREVVAGADTIVPVLRDPRQLRDLAAVLISNGVVQYGDVLQNWGEDAVVRAELRPLAEAVARVLDRCSQRGREEADTLAERFGNSPSRAMQKEYAALDSLATSAHYERLMADYYLAMALDRSDAHLPRVARAAVDGLREFDCAESRVQPRVRIRMAQLLLVQGDYDGAKGVLDTVAGDLAGQIEPAPSVLQQREARYLKVLCDLRAGRADEVEKGIGGLRAWDRQNLPQERAVQQGAETLLTLLRYRLELLRGDVAGDKAAKERHIRNANAVLEQLAKDRPELSGSVYGRLMKSLPEDVPMVSLETSLLKAMVQRGMAEQTKPAGVPVDAKGIDRAIAACKEILARKGRADPSLMDDVAIVLPQLLEKRGRDGDAVEAYLAYVTTSQNQANRATAMDNALAGIGRMKQADGKSARAWQLLDRALSIAVMQLGRNELAMRWGQRLQEQGRHAEAADAYARVPATDKQYAAAQVLRVQMLMVSGENVAAAAVVQQFLEKGGSEQGAAMLPDLLAKLDADAAGLENSTERVKAVLDARAALSGWLVEWARGNKQESIRKATYRYMVYDAETHYQSAIVQPDATKRGDQLTRTLALYDKLLDANGLALWREGVDPAKVDVAYGDVHVLFSKALALFELGDYRQAAQRLGRLLEDRKLGTPRIVTEIKGELTSEDNPVYWEATYKLYRSNLELAKASAPSDRSRLLEETRNGLKRLYIRDGAQTGGAKWHEQFEKLRQQLIPDFTPDPAAVDEAHQQ